MQTGLRMYKPDKCYSGYTLYCPSIPQFAPNEEPRGEIYLVNMEGEIAHRWPVRTALQSFCRLLPNGNLLYPTNDRSDLGSAGIREIDPKGNVVWIYPCRVDHDFQILDSGNLLIHAITERAWPGLASGMTRHPYMIEVTRAGELVWEWKGEEHLEDLRALLPEPSWRHVMDRAHGQFAFDWAHNNTLQVIPPNRTYERELASDATPRFVPGHIVFSYRSCDVIGVIQRPSGRIVWAWGPGVIDGQHKPHMLPSGRVLLFDNGTLRGYSRVIEVDPLTGTIEWEYVADPPESFSSPYISGAQRLPNGNTLICEGSKQRLFEITRDGEVVWDFINPYVPADSRGAVYRCLRYSEEYVAGLLRAAM
jgi:hypothetical protein